VPIIRCPKSTDAAFYVAEVRIGEYFFLFIIILKENKRLEIG